MDNSPAAPISDAASAQSPCNPDRAPPLEPISAPLRPQATALAARATTPPPHPTAPAHSPPPFPHPAPPKSSLPPNPIRSTNAAPAPRNLLRLQCHKPQPIPPVAPQQPPHRSVAEPAAPVEHHQHPPANIKRLFHLPSHSTPHSPVLADPANTRAARLTPPTPLPLLLY